MPDSFGTREAMITGPERNQFLWVRAGTEIETPSGMEFRSVVSTRVRADYFDNQYYDEVLLWFAAPANGRAGQEQDGQR